MINKYIRFILVSVLLTIYNPLMSKAVAQRLTFSVEDGTAGSTVKIKVGLSESRGIKGFDLILDFSKGNLLSTRTSNFVRNKTFYPGVGFASHNLNSVVEVEPGKFRLLCLFPKNKTGPVEIGAFICNVAENAIACQDQTLTLSGKINTEREGIKSISPMSVKFKVLSDAGKMPRLSLHLGRAIPTGTFVNNYKTGFAIMGNFEYPLRSGFSLCAYIGYNQFKAKLNTSDDTYIFNINTDIRYSANLVSFIFFAEAGPGYYILENTTNRAGINIGCGLRYGVSSNLGLEVAAHYHSIFTRPDRTFFFHLATGLTVIF